MRVLSGVALMFFACWLGPPVPAEPGREIPTEELDLEQLVEVKIATGSSKPISRAPAVASVITAEQIEAMGATHLDEILETVAGLHVSPSFVNLDPIHGIRGIQSSLNSQILILVNGVSIRELSRGGLTLGFRLPVAGISRVEVIRGPGSAIHGADAFAGVINVITKQAREIPETRFGARGGSFGTRNVWFEHGGTLGSWDVALTFDWRESDGDGGRIVEVDTQTALDALFGTTASFAPGPLNSRFELFDFHLELARPRWTARFWGWGNDLGTGPGNSQALDPDGEGQSRQVLFDVVHERPVGTGDWNWTQRLSHLFIDEKSRLNLFPSGAVLPIGSDGNVDFSSSNLVSFPDGVIVEPGEHEFVTSLETVATYSGLPGHRFRLGFGVEAQKTEIKSWQNFGPGVIDGTQPVVDGTLTRLTDTEFIFLPDTDRDHWYVSFQDEWSFAEKWEWTGGARFDQYSDFGGTFNPRLALVWQGHPALTTKLLYGSAFRAPSFALLFARNNPTALGNPNLDPERIDTLELVLDARPTKRMRTALSVFDYEAQDLITLVPDVGQPTKSAQNADEISAYGFEVEFSWGAGRRFRVDANYAWQHAEDKATGVRVARVPKQQFHARVHWKFLEHWSAFGQLNGVGTRTRSASDSRADLGGYSTVDFRLRRARVTRNVDLAITGRNVFDRKGREAAESAIPGDYPIAGRAFLAELVFRAR